MRTEVDDLSRPEVHALLAEHLQDMYEFSPPESVHALNLDGLRASDITFWTVWNETELVACGALKELDPRHGEVKSMRTPASKRRQGAGRFVLSHIIDVARRRGYQRLSLETGAMEPFKPAHRLYESYGFSYCGPFGSYTEDPSSIFISLELAVPLRAAWLER